MTQGHLRGVKRLRANHVLRERFLSWETGWQALLASPQLLNQDVDARLRAYLRLALLSKAIQSLAKHHLLQ